MRVFLLAFLCMNPCIWAQSKAEPSVQTLVFTNVNVVDTRDGRILPDMTVAVRRGRIQAVARFGLIAGNHNVRVIDAAGKYIMPGLWDMDVHTAGTWAGIRICLNRGASELKMAHCLVRIFCSRAHSCPAERATLKPSP